MKLNAGRFVSVSQLAPKRMTCRFFKAKLTHDQSECGAAANPGEAVSCAGVQSLCPHLCGHLSEGRTARPSYTTTAVSIDTSQLTATPSVTENVGTPGYTGPAASFARDLIFGLTAQIQIIFKVTQALDLGLAITSGPKPLKD